VGRIRTIKPDFFLHEGLFDLEQESGLPVRVAFSGLWTQCDREGRFAWRPRKLKTQVMPYDCVDFSDVLDALEAGGFLVRYEADGEEYGAIPSWHDHQSINQREAESRIPAPDDAHARTCTHMNARGEGKGREGKGKEGVSADKPRKFQADEIDLPVEANHDAWREWCEYRKARKKPVTEAAARKQLKLLCRYPIPVQQQIVDTSIQNDYQGLFEPKGGTHGHRTDQPSTRKLSAVERVKANRRAAEAAMGDLGPHDRDVRPSLDIIDGRRTERYVGSGST